MLCVEFIVVIATVDTVQWYCVMCGVYCGYSNSKYSAIVLCCVGVYCGYSSSRYSAMVLCSTCGDYCGYSNSRYSAMVLCCVEFIVVAATLDIVQWYFVVGGVYCGYINRRYSAMILCCVWSLL